MDPLQPFSGHSSIDDCPIMTYQNGQTLLSYVIQQLECFLHAPARPARLQVLYENISEMCRLRAKELTGEELLVATLAVVFMANTKQPIQDSQAIINFLCNLSLSEQQRAPLFCSVASDMPWLQALKQLRDRHAPVREQIRMLAALRIEDVRGAAPRSTAPLAVLVVQFLPVNWHTHLVDQFSNWVQSASLTGEEISTAAQALARLVSRNQDLIDENGIEFLTTIMRRYPNPLFIEKARDLHDATKCQFLAVYLETSEFFNLEMLTHLFSFLHELGAPVHRDAVCEFLVRIFAIKWHFTNSKERYCLASCPNDLMFYDCSMKLMMQLRRIAIRFSLADEALSDTFRTKCIEGHDEDILFLNREAVEKRIPHQKLQNGRSPRQEVIDFLEAAKGQLKGKILDRQAEVFLECRDFRLKKPVNEALSCQEVIKLLKMLNETTNRWLIDAEVLFLRWMLDKPWWFSGSMDSPDLTGFLTMPSLIIDLGTQLAVKLNYPQRELIDSIRSNCVEGLGREIRHLRTLSQADALRRIRVLKTCAQRIVADIKNEKAKAYAMSWLEENSDQRVE